MHWPGPIVTLHPTHADLGSKPGRVASWAAQEGMKLAAFIASSFKFTKDRLGQKCSVKQEHIDRHLMQMYSDLTREQGLASAMGTHRGHPQSKGQLCSRTKWYVNQIIQELS